MGELAVPNVTHSVGNMAMMMNPEAQSQNPGLEGLKGFSWSETVGRDFKIVSEALNVPPGRKKDEHICMVARKYNLSRPTIYRLIKKYREHGLPGLNRSRSTKGVAHSWSDDALKFWLGLVLAREHRKISKKTLYEDLEAEARKNGWQIGSLSNAYYQLSAQITPQLIALQNGGARALDNSLPPILRDYSDLEPFEILVGDQHRFDFWTVDSITGELFRPECYLWQDLRTRLMYGGAVSRKYDSHLMALALRIGVYYFGLFRNIYTDNGKPELSKYIENILQDVKGYHLSVFETINVPVDLGKVDHEIVRCDVKVGQHRKAIVRNAKAKMIEGTFNALEGILRDHLRLPGYVKRLTDGGEQQDVDERELKRLAESGRLPTSEEFMTAFYKALTYYNQRPHRGVLKEWRWQPRPKSATPKNCLEMCIRDGWQPTMISREAIDLLFLPKESQPRTIAGCRVRFRNRFYEHKALIELDGKEVNLRFDPFDPGYILVFRGGVFLCRAEPVEYSSMKDRDLATRKIREKARLRKEIVGQFQSLTAGIPDVRQFSEVPKLEMTAALIGKDKRQKAIENEELFRERTKEQLALEVAEIKTVSETIQHTPQNNNESATRPAFFLNDSARYKWILVQCVENREISTADQDFKEAHEAEMDPETLEYWKRRQKFKEVGSSC